MQKVSVLEVEDHMAVLQELKGLYAKIAEDENVEEALKITTAETCTVHRELELPKFQLVDMENRLASQESFTNELTLELETIKVSETKVMEEVLAVDNLLLATKENLQADVSKLEAMKLKLNKEVCAKELVEASMKNQESQIIMFKEEMSSVSTEKEALEVVVANLSCNTAQTRELYSDLEAKLQLSDENFCKAYSLLSQGLANSTELELKLRSLEELQRKSGYAVTTVAQKYFSGSLALSSLLQVGLLSNEPFVPVTGVRVESYGSGNGQSSYLHNRQWTISQLYKQWTDEYYEMVLVVLNQEVNKQKCSISVSWEVACVLTVQVYVLIFDPGGLIAYPVLTSYYKSSHFKNRPQDAMISYEEKCRNKCGNPRAWKLKSLGVEVEDTAKGKIDEFSCTLIPNMAYSKFLSIHKNNGLHMRELLLDFYDKTQGRKPSQTVVFKDGVGESQFSQVLNNKLYQNDSGQYITLYNIYAFASRWNEATEVRKAMIDLGGSIESGAIMLGAKQTQSKCSLVLLFASARDGFTGLTVSKHFRDNEGQDVPLFIDNSFKFTHAIFRLSILLGSILFATGIITQEIADDPCVTDTRPDDVKCRITIKFIGISPYYGMRDESLNSYKGENKGNKQALKVIDSPGHVKFSCEIGAALCITDCALVVVNCIEDVCVQTEIVQSPIERIREILTVNKMDMCFFELQVDGVEAYQKYQRAIEIENENVIRATYVDPLLTDFQVDPEEWSDNDRFLTLGSVISGKISTGLKVKDTSSRIFLAGATVCL